MSDKILPERINELRQEMRIEVLWAAVRALAVHLPDNTREEFFTSMRLLAKVADKFNLNEPGATTAEEALHQITTQSRELIDEIITDVSAKKEP